MHNAQHLFRFIQIIQIVNIQIVNYPNSESRENMANLTLFFETYYQYNINITIKYLFVCVTWMSLSIYEPENWKMICLRLNLCMLIKTV